MRLALVQMAHAGTIQLNLQKSLQAMETAARKGADLILFPEVQLTEFFPQYPGRDVRQYAITVEDPMIQEFCRACRNYHVMAVPNVYLKEESGYYDASLLIGRDGSILGIQKMVHVAQAKHFYEQDYYTPSDEGFQVFETESGTIGIVVCFDRHYPESIRTETLMGADLILIPTVNTTAEPSDMFAWELRVQAFQNSVAIAMCNRVGREDEMHFSGESIVLGANGEILALADDTEQIVYAELDLQKVKQLRGRKNYTNLRRPAFYL